MEKGSWHGLKSQLDSIYYIKYKAYVMTDIMCCIRPRTMVANRFHIAKFEL